MGTKHVAEEVKEKSGIDEEKEEILGVGNILEVVDLERELKIRDLRLEEKEKELEKERTLKEEERKLKEEERKRHKEELKEKDKEIERLKAQLKDKKD